jgi:glycosyltransferase involved in cell wall biosynthesis
MPRSSAKTPEPSLDKQFVVLLASARSGTHLLKRILTSDPIFEETSETFRPTNFDKYHTAPNFWKFLRSRKATARAEPLSAEQRGEQWHAYLAFLKKSHPDTLKILDFKYNNLRSADAGYLWPEAVPTMLQLAKRDELPIIQLKRRNHLKIICSERLARRTQEWVRPKTEKNLLKQDAPVAPIHMDVSDVLYQLDDMQRRDTLVDFWVAGYHRKIKLIYEELLFDGQLSQATIDTLEAFFGRTLNIRPEPRTLKVSPPLEELIENFGEVKLALAGTPYAKFIAGKPKSKTTLVHERTASAAENVAGRDEFPCAHVLSSNPLVTLLSDGAHLRGFNALALAAPDIFQAKQAMHLLHIRHTLEAGSAGELAQCIARAKIAYPGHLFLPLTATDHETFLLAQLGVPSLVANGLIFVDERVWRPGVPPFAGLPMFDAIYVARLDPDKRHELAKDINSLSLVYGHSLSQAHSTAYEQARQVFPDAFFANHSLSAGGDLAPEMVCRLLGHARVGLCLSAVEGSMRSSMEYLLAGVPVVSTPSLGGRDRYYVAPYCRVVEANPSAVAGAVRELAAKGLDRQKIRQHVAQLVGFDRYNFLMNVNKIAKRHFGKDNLFPEFLPMIGGLSPFRPTSEVVKILRNEFSEMKTA